MNEGPEVDDRSTTVDERGLAHMHTRILYTHAHRKRERGGGLERCSFAPLCLRHHCRRCTDIFFSGEIASVHSPERMSSNFFLPDRSRTRQFWPGSFLNCTAHALILEMSMIRLRHYVFVNVFLFLLLLPISLGATDQPRSGHGDVAMERRPAEEHILSFNISDRLLMIGSIQMNTSASRRKDCLLDIFIEIGNNRWKQQLKHHSFVFQVPMRSCGGMIGMVSIHDRGEKWQRLWNHFFVVQDIGIERVNATLSGDCTRIKIPESALIPWIPSSCPPLSVMGKIGRLPVTRPLTEVSRMCRVPFRHSVENSCIITGAMEALMSHVKDQLWNYSGESSDWHRVFGVNLLRTWHLHCLGIVFLYLQTVNWLLRILESVSAIALSNLDPPDTEEPPRMLLDREARTSCTPVSDTSFSGLSRQASMQLRQGSALPLSADIFYQNSWGDAHQYLDKLMNFPEDGSGYYYNCTVQRRSISELRLQSGRWSRDSNGRLIRDLP